MSQITSYVIAMDKRDLDYESCFDGKRLIYRIIHLLRDKFESGEITVSRNLRLDIVKGLIARRDLPTDGCLFVTLLMQDF